MINNCVSIIQNMLTRPTIISAILLGLAGASPAVSADSVLSGKKSIYLSDIKGNEVVIGSVVFKPQGETSQFEVTINYEDFTDYFLSMKEMKCLEGPELWCHLNYPYPQPRVVSATDLRWLAYDLLFMFKKPKEFGANFWNGIYYEFSIQGNSIKGEAQAVDLNHLAAPPDTFTIPPYTEFDIEPIELSNRWLPYIEIK